MDKLVNYRNWIKELLTNYADHHSNKKKDVEEELIFDENRDHYQIMAVGWENRRRVYFSIFHLNIKDGKIWLQENSADYNIVDDLLERGVPPSDIVIGFLPAHVRATTEFAVA